jgi:signal transduction histidine kinase/ActR/RegA family two-component response regulator
MFLWWGPELIQFYNDAYLPSFGVGKHPAAMGQPGRECWPEIWPIIGPQIEDVMLRGVPSWNEDQLVPIQRNGRLEEVYWTYGYSPVFDDAGSVSGTLVVCTETTARVIAERRLGLLRALSDALLDSADPADTLRLAALQLESGSFDVPFAIISSADEARRLVGIEGADGAQIRAFVGARVVEPRTLALPSPLTAGPWPEPITTLHVIPILGSGNIVFGVSPRLPFDESYRLFLTQVARLIESSHARARVDSERRNLLELAPVAAALMIGPHHVFEIANELYVEMFGREVRGKTYIEAFPELRDGPLPEILDRVYRTGEPFVTNEMSIPLVRKATGAVEESFFKFNLAPIRDAEDQVCGMMAIAVDISDQVIARKELQLAARAKDEFLATMSHELRTPLNAILGWSRILKHDLADTAKVQRGIAVIERNANAQATLVSDLLDVSRIITGKMTLSLRRLDVASALGAALDVVRPAADAKGVRLDTEIPADIGIITADPDRLQQILWNLLSNAIRFTPPEGHVRVVASREDSWLRIRVADTGQGIQRRHLLNIFDRFRQIEAATTRQHGGLGLGLAIVRYLVEAHGGSISAQSEGAGKGSTFDVRLPTQAESQTAMAETSSRLTPSSPIAAPSPTRLQRVRVLAVDDHHDSLELLRAVLEAAGANVTGVSSVAEALTAPGPFDVIVSDIGMPDADGYELIRAIRAREQGADVPVIALTAYARAEDAARAKSAGFSEHLAKPVHAEELLSVVERCVESRRARAS